MQVLPDELDEELPAVLSVRDETLRLDLTRHVIYLETSGDIEQVRVASSSSMTSVLFSKVPRLEDFESYR